MTLIGILGALALERLLSHWSYWQTHDLTGHWLAWLRQRAPSAWFWQTRWGLACLILPPVIAVWASFHYLFEPIGLLIELAAAVVVLLACLGPRDMAEEINSYRAARETGDGDEAREILDDLLAGPGRRNGERENRSVVSAAFVQGHERWFAVIIFFFVLGPLGAVLYRLSASIPSQLRQLSVEGELLETADRWHVFAALISSRVTALCYVMAGSTDHAMNAWSKWRLNYSGRSLRDSWSLLGAVGAGALGLDSEESLHREDNLDAVLGVLNRSLLILLAVLALFTLGGWLA